MGLTGPHPTGAGGTIAPYGGGPKAPAAPGVFHPWGPWVGVGNPAPGPIPRSGELKERNPHNLMVVVE
jgi:hypothetical protein